ncbi:MAG: Gfo/Idh/MocA family oxidoreductase [Epulopiscium sp.]|nr:Gfo/Idh/MocA family oxidoreductase [Candidatus Epulonipiscium sp.]
MMKNYNLAIVGFGGMGNEHNEKIKGVKNLTVVGVYDIKSQRQEYAKQKGLKAYDSLDGILSDPKIDIVLIATPNDVHKDIAIKALKAGKNVICEKPVTLNSIELKEIIATANQYKKLFVVHQNRRWDEDFLTMKKIYDEHLLGDIFTVESRVHGSRGIPGDWRQKKECGGGMLLDWGVHILDQMVLMIQEKIKTVYCQFTYVTNSEVDDGFKLILTFESGKTALLEVGTSNFINLPRWYMLGENGSAIIEDWDLNGKIVRVKGETETNIVPVRTAAGLTKTMAPRREDTIFEEELPKQIADVRDFYRNVINVLSGKEEIIVRNDQVLRIMNIIDTAFESARLNQVLEFK